MSQVASQIAAGCDCRCREVYITYARYEDGIVSPLVGTAPVISHTDADCLSRSPDMLQLPVLRSFPVRNADCTPADAVVITVTSTFTDQTHVGWEIESDGETERILGSAGFHQALSLRMTQLGPRVTVRALFSWSPLGDGEDPPVACSEKLLFPSHIEITLPASFDFSNFNLPGETCRLRSGTLQRVSDVFNREGPSTIILKCENTTGMILESFADYVYRSPSGVCARASVRIGWEGNRRDGLYVYISASVQLTFVDFAATPDLVSRIFLNTDTIAISSPLDYDTVVSWYHGLTENDPANCDDNGYPCIPAIFPGSPVAIYSGGSALAHFGIDTDWLHVSGGFYLMHYAGAGCDLDEWSIPPGQPFAIPPSVTNTSYSIDMDAVSPAQNGPTDCECVANITDASGNPVEVRTSALYVNSGGSADTDPCECTTVYEGYTINCFPERIAIELPDSLDLTDYRDTDCTLSFGGAPPLSAIGTGALTRDSSLRKRLILQGECSTTTINAWSGGDGTIPFGAWNQLTRSIANQHAYWQRYEPTDTAGTAWSNIAFVYLVAGYLSQPKNGVEADTLVRFFTACYIKFRVKNGGTEDWMQVWAANLGPEGSIAGLSTAQIREYAQVNGRWNWIHNWGFSNFSICAFPDGHWVDGGDSPCQWPRPAPPQANYCPWSVVPNLFRASQAAKDSGFATPAAFCPDCDATDSYWSGYCMEQYGPQWLWPDLRIYPTFAPATSIDSSSERFIRYTT